MIEYAGDMCLLLDQWPHVRRKRSDLLDEAEMMLESDIVDSDEWIRWASLSVQAGACAISAPCDKKRARDGITARLRPTARGMPGAICDTNCCYVHVDDLE